MNITRLAMVLCLLGAWNISAQETEKKPPADLIKLVNALPAKLTALNKEKERELEGSTHEMIQGCSYITEKLTADAAKLGSFMNGVSVEEAKKELIRDQEAISRASYYSDNEYEPGGTMSSVSAAGAALDYTQIYIGYCVTEIFRDSATFKLEDWQKKWQALTGSEEDKEGN